MFADPPAFLSLEAFADFKAAIIDEFGPDHTDQAIEEMGLRLLHLFGLLIPATTPAPKRSLSEEEVKALSYIEACGRNGKIPTVRGVAEAIGKRSSRSGLRMVDALLKREFVTRDREGRLTPTDQNSSSAA